MVKKEAYAKDVEKPSEEADWSMKHQAESSISFGKDGEIPLINLDETLINSYFVLDPDNFSLLEEKDQTGRLIYLEDTSPVPFSMIKLYDINNSN